jgi:cholesterol transport system auxiliary component
MNNRQALRALLLTAGLLLGGCAAKPDTIASYDLGPLRAGTATQSLPPVSVAEVRVPAWLDSQRMFYRLNYANDQQPRAYADSRWTMPPGQLFVQRLKSRLSQAGGVVVPAAAGALNIPVLYIEADDFSQVFERADSSRAHIEIRASVFDGRFLRAQKMFVRDLSADSADAHGGVTALAGASDAIIDDIAAWLANLPAKK